MEAQVFFEEPSRLFVNVGVKGSGKTHLALAYIWESMQRNRFEHYYLCIPAFSSEMSNAYHWLRGCKNVTYCDTYSEQFVEMVVHRQNQFIMKKARAKNQQEVDTLDMQHKRVFLFLDDASGFAKDLSSSPIFRQLITTTRHAKITVMLCVHAIKNILTPVVRANVDHLIIGQLTNSKMLDGIYEEFISLTGVHANSAAFKKWFTENVKDYNMLLISLKHSIIGNTKTLPMIKRFNTALESKKDPLITNKAQWPTKYQQRASVKQSSILDRMNDSDDE